MIIIIIIMEIHAGAHTVKVYDSTRHCTYNIKSFTYEIINTCMRTRTPHTHHTYKTHPCADTYTHMHEHVVRNLYRGKYVRETRVEG